MTTTSTATGPSIDLLMEINAAFNSRDVDRILSFFADDATFLMARGPEPCGRRVHGKAAIGKVLADRFKVISGMRWDHIDHFVTGNRAVSVWMVTGTGRGRRAAQLPGLRHLRVPRRQDPQQGHLLEAGRAGRPPVTAARWPTARPRSSTTSSTCWTTCAGGPAWSRRSPVSSTRAGSRSSTSTWPRMVAGVRTSGDERAGSRSSCRGRSPNVAARISGGSYDAATRSGAARSLPA